MVAFLLWLFGGAAAFGLGTLWIGWWAVPIVALLLGWLVPRSVKPLLLVPLAAVLAWTVLLVRAAQAPAFDALWAHLSALLPVPPAALLVVTLVFAALLALGAALIGQVIRRDGSRPA